jgi:hypothetical protein
VRPMVRPNPGNVLRCTAPLTPAPAITRSMLRSAESEHARTVREIAAIDVVRVPDFSVTFQFL